MTTTFTPDHDHDDDVHDLAALYAIDALDADEAEQFAHHLPGCPACQREVTELRTASTALALATALPLPPGLRQRVLAEVAHQPQVAAPPAAPVPPAPAPPAVPADPLPPAPAPPAPPAPSWFDPAVTGEAGPAEGGPGSFDPAVTGGAEVVRFDRARGRRRPGRGTARTRLLAVAAAAVVVLAGAVGALAAVRGAGRNGSEGGDRAAAEAAFAAVRAAPDARTLTLTGGDDPGARVRLAWSAAQDRVVLLADGVPDPGPGRTYELWRIDEAGPDPAGLFEPDGSGQAGLVAPLGGADPAAWGVTVEPAGGSPEPTPPIVYQGEA